jgi:acyl-coenzyme A synthetase/AMP-(fatty) acid ligase
MEFESPVDGPIEFEIEEPPALAYAYPQLGEETASTPFAPYPKADERPVNDAIAYYLHSSGSTGFPKPIPITHLTAMHWCFTREYWPRFIRDFNSLVPSPYLRDQR